MIEKKEEKTSTDGDVLDRKEKVVSIEEETNTSTNKQTSTGEDILDQQETVVSIEEETNTSTDKQTSTGEDILDKQEKVVSIEEEETSTDGDVLDKQEKVVSIEEEETSTDGDVLDKQEEENTKTIVKSDKQTFTDIEKVVSTKETQTRSLPLKGSRHDYKFDVEEGIKNFVEDWVQNANCMFV
jgi:hypothetical protein